MAENVHVLTFKTFLGVSFNCCLDISKQLQVLKEEPERFTQPAKEKIANFGLIPLFFSPPQRPRKLRLI